MMEIKGTGHRDENYPDSVGRKVQRGDYSTSVEDTLTQSDVVEASGNPLLVQAYFVVIHGTVLDFR